jgi:hypothetical protein
MGEANVALVIRISSAWVNPKGAGLGPDLGNVLWPAVRICLYAAHTVGLLTLMGE